MEPRTKLSHTCCVRVQILGPLDVEDGAQAMPSGKISRRVLVALAAGANTAIHPNRLADMIWPDQQRSAGNSLQAHISRWRKVLGGNRISFSPGGYTLNLAPSELDAFQFETLADQAHRSRAAGLLAQSIEEHEKALALWRGTSFADLPDNDSIGVRRVELEQLRSHLKVARLEMLCETASYERVILDASALCEFEYWSEPVHRVLARSHYAIGDQAAALGVLANLQDRLRADLGIDLGAASALLREQILRQEPALDAPRDQADIAPPDALKPRLISIPSNRIADRVAELPEITRKLLFAAALSGRELDTAQLGRAMGVDGATLADALVPGLRAGLVVRDERSISFAANHIREAIVETLSAGEALEWHRRLGEALLIRGEEQSNIIRAADHLAAAAPLAPEIARRAANLDHRLAGDARAQGRSVDAVRHARRALASADLVSRREPPPNRSELWFSLGESLRDTATLDAAMAAYAAAGEHPDATAETIIRAALAYEECSLHARRHRLGNRDPAILLLRRALERSASEGSAHVEVLASLAQALMFSGLAEQAASAGDEALERARELGAPEILVRALLRRLSVHDPLTEFAERARLATEAAELSTSIEADELELDAFCALVPELMRAGNLSEAEQVISRVGELAQMQGNRLHRCKVPMWRAALALVAGHYDEAEILIEDFHREGERDGYEDTARVHGFQSILLALGRGEADRAASLVAAFDDDDAFEPWIATRLLVAHANNDSGAVQKILMPWSARRFAVSRPFAGVRVFCACLIAEVVAQLGDQSARRRLSELIELGAGQNQVLGAGAAILDDGTRSLALLRMAGE